MKKKILTLTLLITGFLNTSIHAAFISEMPKETVVLQLPDHSESNWKEITRHVSAKEGIIEMIPLNQSVQNWSELILIQYKGFADWEKSICSIDEILEHIRKEMIYSYPKDTASWQIIEKNKEGTTYEWLVHKPYKGVPIQHVVFRAFLTSSGFHCIGFTRKDSHMSSQERAKWIKLFRENASVVPFQDGKYTDGFSMVAKHQDSAFKDPFELDN